MPRLAPIHYAKLAHIFERTGFVLDRTEGDHLIIKNNLRSAGMTREEYFRLLEII